MKYAGEAPVIWDSAALLHPHQTDLPWTATSCAPPRSACWRETPQRTLSTSRRPKGPGGEPTGGHGPGAEGARKIEFAAQGRKRFDWGVREQADTY